MPSELEELVGFIADRNPQIRLLATENLVPYSLSDPGIFKTDGLKPIKHLKLLINDQPKIAEYVLSILINLSADKKVLESLTTDEKFLNTVLSYVTSPSEPNANLLAMLLANLAKWNNLKFIAEKKQDPPNQLQSDEHVLNQLLDLFVKGEAGAYNKDADYDHLAYMFADLTKHAEIRQHFLQRQDYDNVIPISKLNVFTEHKSHVRRKGVASTIKNVAFELSSHPAFLDEEEINILPYVLLPITGNEEYDEEETSKMLPDLQLLPPDKQRDSDLNIILTHVETLLLLSTTKEGREHMRRVKVYPVVRETHMRVDNTDVKEACERLVQMLMRFEDDADIEPHVQEIMEEDEDDQLVEV